MLEMLRTINTPGELKTAKDWKGSRSLRARSNSMHRKNDAEPAIITQFYLTPSTNALCSRAKRGLRPAPCSLLSLKRQELVRSRHTPIARQPQPATESSPIPKPNEERPLPCDTHTHRGALSALAAQRLSTHLPPSVAIDFDMLIDIAWYLPAHIRSSAAGPASTALTRSPASLRRSSCRRTSVRWQRLCYAMTLCTTQHTALNPHVYVICY